MQILNSDGSDAVACGNGTRCVADYVMRDLGRDKISIDTASGLLQSWRTAAAPTILLLIWGRSGLTGSRCR